MPRWNCGGRLFPPPASPHIVHDNMATTQSGNLQRRRLSCARCWQKPSAIRRLRISACNRPRELRRPNSYLSARTSAGLGLPPMPHPAGSSDTSGLGAQSASGTFLVAHTQKPPGLDRRPAVALRLRGGLLRRAVLENVAVPTCQGTHDLNEASGALPMCRANDPRSYGMCHRR